MNIGIFTTLSGARYNSPLPVRELEKGSSAGHLVQASDWALLVELCEERLPLEDRYTVIPWGILDGQRVYNHAWWVRANLMPAAASLFLDPDWTPTGGEGFWINAGKQAHMIQLQSPAVVEGNSRRTVESVRAMFRDMKRLVRFCSHCTVTPKDAAGNTGSMGYTRFSDGTIERSEMVRAEVGDITNIPAAVKYDAWFSATPEFAIVQVVLRRQRGTAAAEQAERYLPASFTAAGVSVDGWTTADLETMMHAAFGDYEDGVEYVATANVAAVYHRVQFPLDRLLSPWNG